MWTLSRHHDVIGDDLRAALSAVAEHRRVELVPLITALDGYAAVGQERWAAWWANQLLDTPIPDDFGAVLAAVEGFADQALEGRVAGRQNLDRRDGCLVLRVDRVATNTRIRAYKSQSG